MKKASRLLASSAMAPMGSNSRMPRPLTTPPAAHRMKPMATESTSACVRASRRRLANGQPAQRDQRDAGQEIQRADERQFPRSLDGQSTARAHGELAGKEQPAGHQQPIQVDQPDDTPGQVGGRVPDS